MTQSSKITARGWDRARGTFAAALLARTVLLGASSAFASVIDRTYFRADSVVIVFGASDFTENGGVATVVFDFALLDEGASGTAAPDIIGADGTTINYNTSRYNPSSDGSESGWEFEITDQTFGGTFTSAGPHQTLDANDSYTAFGLDDDTDMDLLGSGNRASRFYVASNAAFDIFGEASGLTATGDFSSLDYTNIRYRMRMQVSGGSGVNRWGQRAQNPSTGGSGLTVSSWTTLDDLASGPIKVFDGGRRTAEQRGSIMQQAVSFQSLYQLRGAGINGNNYDFSMGAGALGAEVTYTIYTP